MTKVSVLTPIYNTNPQHLREAIESILKQTFTDFEFIILNDSPNNTEIEQIVTSYTDTRIKYYKNKKNLGISTSRNKLLELAQGEYIAIFDHDDICLPYRLEKQVKYLDNNPDIGVVSGNLEYIHGKFKTQHPISNLEIKNNLPWKCVVAHPASMIRKSILIQNHIKYEDIYSPAEDYMLWIKLIDKTMFSNLSDILIQYRDHSLNTTHKQHIKMLDKSALIQNYAIQKYPFFAFSENYSRDITNTELHLADSPQTISSPTNNDIFSNTLMFLKYIPIFTHKHKPHKDSYKILGVTFFKINHKKPKTQTYYLFNLPIIQRITK